MRRAVLAVALALVAGNAAGQVEPPPSPPRAHPGPVHAEPPPTSPAAPEPTSKTSPAAPEVPTPTSTPTSTATPTPTATPAATDTATPTDPPPANIPAAPPSQPSWRPAGWDLAVSGWGGPYDGDASSASGGGADLALLLLGDTMAFGPRISVEAVGDTAGFGVGVALGPRFPLASWARLDVVADAGVAVFGKGADTDCTGLLYCKRTASSRATVPMLGLRTGITFLPGDGRTTFTVGASARFLAERRVEVTEQTCGTIIPSCGEQTVDVKRYGGRVLGGFITIGFPRRF